MMIYLDHAATTPVHPHVRAAMTAAMNTHWANPSSIHPLGTAAKTAYVADKQELLRLLGLAENHQVVATASASEATSLLLLGWAAQHGPRGTLLVGSTEHSCVLEAAKAASERYGTTVQLLPVDKNGTLRLDVLDGFLSTAGLRPVLLSTMAANNETGAMADMRGIAALVQQAKKTGANLTWHSDVVQYVATLPCSDATWMRELDALTLTAHKLGAPRGAGALVARPQALAKLQAQVLGGGQENHLRSGTEATILFHAMVTGLRLAQENASGHNQLTTLRDALQARITTAHPKAMVVAGNIARLPGHLLLAIPGINGEALVQTLGAKGVYTSTGSACASNDATHGPSHVLQAHGLPGTHVSGSLRLTLGYDTTPEEVQQAGDALLETLKQLGADW